MIEGAARSVISRPKAILLDWDNTLVDNSESIHEAMIATLLGMGHAPWPLAETQRRARRSLRESFPEIFGDQWERAREIFHQRFAADHLNGLKTSPGAEDMLAGLATRGIYLAVVSNKTGSYLRREAAHLGWDRYFGAIVGATDAEADKPAVAPVDLALAKSGVVRGRSVWFVGDGAVDMDCAHRAGCVAVLLRGQPPGEHEFAPNPPDRHVTSCADLAAFVDALATVAAP